MSNLIENFRLDENRREILKMRTAALGISKSQYLRSLIDKDNLGRFRKSTDDAYEEWKAIRFEILLSDTKKALLQALKKEFEDLGDNKSKRIKTVARICKKYGLDKRIAVSDLNDLIRLNIFTKNNAKSRYAWTLEGIIIIPEFAFALSHDGFLFSGDMAYLLNVFLGKYNDVLRYFTDVLGMNEEESHTAFEIILGEHVKYITWVREISFSFSGIIDPDDIQYYRRQMTLFLFNYLMMNKENQKALDDNMRNMNDRLISLLAGYLSKPKM